MPVIERIAGEPVYLYTGLAFTYVLLPVALAVHRLLPYGLRAGMLTLISILLYFILLPVGFPFIAVCVVLDYAVAQIMRVNDGRQAVRRLCVLFCIIKGIAAILIAGLLVRENRGILIFGTLVCALSGMEAVIEMYKRECEYERGFIKFCLYCCFLPRLFAGPLYTYADFDAQLKKPAYSGKTLFSGATVFVAGLFKASVFGTNLSALYVRLLNFPDSEISVFYGWVQIIIFALAVYYYLSGLCEMAQGTGEMFGFKFPRNFYYPYQSRSVTDFLERFNMTLTAFIKRRTFTAMNKGGRFTGLIGLALTGVLSGLWFGLSFGAFLWGIYLTLFMLMERYVLKKVIEYTPTLLGRFFTLCVTVFGLMLLSSGSLTESVNLARIMFGFVGGYVPFYTDKILYELSSNWLLLVSACFFSSSIAGLVMDWISKNLPKAYILIEGSVSLALLAVFTAFSLRGLSI